MRPVVMIEDYSGPLIEGEVGRIERFRFVVSPAVQP